jgi:hypothetical protein
MGSLPIDEKFSFLKNVNHVPVAQLVPQWRKVRSAFAQALLIKFLKT